MWFSHIARSVLFRFSRNIPISREVSFIHIRGLNLGDTMPSESEDSRHIAHDLNNVLGTILNYAEIIERRVGADQALLRAVRKTKQAVHKGALLTEKLAEGALPPTSSGTDLVKVLRDLAPMLQKGARDGVSVQFSIDPAPILVPVESHDLAQLILNLTTNSLDALPQRLEVQVRKVLRPLPRAQGTLSALLAVTDDGCGMSDEIAARAFEPFFTTKTGLGSWGLGLTLADRVVSKCGGVIEIQSTSNGWKTKGRSDHGTRVEVYLPTAEISPQPAQEVSNLEGKGETVLVVDDDHDLRYLVGRMLSDNGYRVLDASTPQEAVSLASQAESIDAVLTDVVMPSMPGTELADILRQRFGGGLKVLFLSGFSGGGELRDAQRVLSKPFTERELLHRLRRILDSRIESR